MCLLVASTKLYSLLHTNVCVPAALHHHRGPFVTYDLPNIDIQPDSSTQAAYPRRPPRQHAPENMGPLWPHAPHHSQRYETHSWHALVYNMYLAWLKSCEGY